MVARATVDSNNEFYSLLFGAFDEFWAHTVAVDKAVREHDFDVFGFDAGEF